MFCGQHIAGSKQVSRLNANTVSAGATLHRSLMPNVRISCVALSPMRWPRTRSGSTASVRNTRPRCPTDPTGARSRSSLHRCEPPVPSLRALPNKWLPPARLTLSCAIFAPATRTPYPAPRRPRRNPKAGCKGPKRHREDLTSLIARRAPPAVGRPRSITSRSDRQIGTRVASSRSFAPDCRRRGSSHRREQKRSV
jgi:hypothetical protein